MLQGKQQPTRWTFDEIFLLFLCVLIIVLIAAKEMQAKSLLTNYQPGVETRVFIQPKHCHDIERGEYMCDKVRFEPLVVRVGR